MHFSIIIFHQGVLQNNLFCLKRKSYSQKGLDSLLFVGLFLSRDLNMTVQYSILFIVPAKASITITHTKGWGFSEPLFQACNLHICATNMNYSLNCFVALDNQKKKSEHHNNYSNSLATSHNTIATVSTFSLGNLSLPLCLLVPCKQHLIYCSFLSHSCFYCSKT